VFPFLLEMLFTLNVQVDIIQAIIRKALADSTTKSYLSILTPFSECCNSLDISVIVATAVNFVNYAHECASPKYSFSTI
jgi:hypothetical protein